MSATAAAGLGDPLGGLGGERATRDATRDAGARRIPILGDLANITDAKPMSATEARDSRAELIESYAQYATLADDTITRTNRYRTPAIIWQTMTDEELGILADLALERARSSAIAAQAVRGMIRSSRLVKAGFIVGPRAYATLHHYADNGGLVLPFGGVPGGN